MGFMLHIQGKTESVLTRTPLPTANHKKLIQAQEWRVGVNQHNWFRGFISVFLFFHTIFKEIIYPHF